MKYLITGGCGFLGSNIASEILGKKEELVIFDNLSRLGSVDNLKWLQSLGNFNFIHGDIRNCNEVLELIRGNKPDIIFHLAGQVAMTTSIQNPRKDFEINALGSLNVLEAVRKYSPNTAVIYSSTNKVYGDLESINYEETDSRYIINNYKNGFDETVSLDFHSPYGCSKGTADQYMLDYSRIYGLKTAVFRHSSMYGGRQYATYDQGWIGWFCQQALLQRSNSLNSFTISGNGKQVRDVLHADDIKKLYLTAADKIDIISGQAFNIGAGMDNSLSLLELFALLEKLLNINLNYTKIPVRESDQKVFVADINKISKMVQWQPRISPVEGIDNTIKWLLSRNK
jgi:CDP-paratose 2-epimerase